MKPPVPENLCAIPWRGFTNEPDGKVKPCCFYKGFITDESDNDYFLQKDSIEEIFNSPFMQKLREDFRQNKKPIECNICWKDEEAGYQSKRKIMLFSLEYFDWENEPEFPSDYQLILSNSCNLKCRSCGPSHSTTWQKENRKFDGNSGFEMPMKQAGDTEGVFWKNRHTWYANLRNLDIVGGEPMYIKQWHTIFDELIELGYSKNINLTMSTNCTIIVPGLIEKLIDNFRSTQLHLSIDGLEKIFEYLRHPAKWDLAYSNMKIYHDLIDSDSSNFRVTITNTVSWLNVLDMSKIHQMLKKDFPKFTRVWYNPVHGPVEMSLECIPEELKVYISHRLKEYDWEDQQSDIDAIANMMFSSKTDPTVFAEHLEEYDKIDRRRKENIWDVMPKEYLPFLNTYKKNNIIITDYTEE